MKQVKEIWRKDEFILRLARPEDAEAYYSQNFNPLDPEVARLTGCRQNFTHDEVVHFFLQCTEANDRYDFLIFAPDGRIIGECVINEIDWEARKANFRIGIFHASERGRGIGSWAVRMTRDFAFANLKLHRLELDVYACNPRAEKAYLAAGFKREGVLRDAIWDGEQYIDDILMSILEDEWREMKRREL